MFKFSFTCQLILKINYINNHMLLHIYRNYDNVIKIELHLFIVLSYYCIKVACELLRFTLYYNLINNLLRKLSYLTDSPRFILLISLSKKQNEK